jgi:hypothetical protein
MDPTLRRILFGTVATMAPPNDQGGGADDDLDDEALDFDDDDEDDTGDQDDDLDDSGDPDDDLGDEGDADPEPPKRQSRGESRAASAAKIAAEAKREAAALRAELEETKRQRNAPATETTEQFQARLDAMDPLSRVDYLRQLDRQIAQNAIRDLEHKIADSTDRSEFEALCARNPTAAKLKDEVETKLAELRRSGQTVPRGNILRFLIGERALSKEPRARGKAERDAASRRQRHDARPGNGRSDAGPESRRGDSKAARDKRLENMDI